MLDHAVIDSLFPADLPEPEHWERQYPPRDLPEGAEVTRFGPSPTGFVHVGGVYVAMIDQDVSARTGGRYVVRVEDTDQSREVEGALAQFDRAFDYFRIQPTEGEGNGEYGPYHQSARERIYLTYVRHLLRHGQAYLCFATRDELADITARQQAVKLPPGYYGTWAIWRDADPDRVRAELAKGTPYVVRFRAPDETVGQRARFVDVIRGELEHEANRNDVVILKSSDQPVRLPTYHFAHAVDDHLMRTTLVIRGEEWISSVPLHLQLFDALGFGLPKYAHIAPLMKQIPGGKRKLSKRKDPEASVDFYMSAGYPADAVLYYQRGLANGRLAELPLTQALAEPIRLEECGVAGPLVDLVKLEDIAADHVATLTGEQILEALRPWAAEHDPELLPVLDTDLACGPWRSSVKASRTPARTCASGPTSGPRTASSSPSCTPRSPTRPTSVSAASTPSWSRPSWPTSPTATSHWTTAASGSTRSASSPPSTASPRTRRSSRRTPTRTRAPSARPPSSSA